MSAFRKIVAHRRPSMIQPEMTVDEPAPSQSGTGSPEVSAQKPVPVRDPADEIGPPANARPASRPVPVEEPAQSELQPSFRTMGDDIAPDKAPAEGPTDIRNEPDPVLPESKIWDLETTPDMPQARPTQDQPVDDATILDLTDRVAREVAGDSPADTAGVSNSPKQAEEKTPVAAPPSRAQGRRAKTRLLGFHADDLVPDPFASGQKVDAVEEIKCPVGFLVIVDGPGFGTSFSLAAGLSTLGRGEDQSVTLNFGDDSISRQNHASIAYDEEENQVLIGHGGKSNLVRLNGKPIVSTEELSQGDQIRIGKTTLRYAALCGPEFGWSKTVKEAGSDV